MSIWKDLPEKVRQAIVVGVTGIIVAVSQAIINYVDFLNPGI